LAPSVHSLEIFLFALALNIFDFILSSSLELFHHVQSSYKLMVTSDETHGTYMPQQANVPVVDLWHLIAYINFNSFMQTVQTKQVDVELFLLP